MTVLWNFEDLIKEYSNYSKSLLLGNGFSIACSNIFSYDSILQNLLSAIQTYFVILLIMKKLLKI